MRIMEKQNDVDTNLPEDAKDYLKQLGFGQYDTERVLPSDPGKYYDNVPLEENPEAYLDVLSRESIRRKSKEGSRRSGAKGHATAPKKASPEVVGRRAARAADAHAKAASSSGNSHTQGNNDSPSNKRNQASAKKVSFNNEQMVREIRDEQADGQTNGQNSEAQQQREPQAQQQQQQQVLQARKLRKTRSFKTVQAACPVLCFSNTCAYGYATAAILQSSQPYTLTNSQVEPNNQNTKKSNKFTSFFGIRTKKGSVDKSRDEPEGTDSVDGATSIQQTALPDLPDGAPSSDIVSTHHGNTPSPPVDLLDSCNESLIQQSQVEANRKPPEQRKLSNNSIRSQQGVGSSEVRRDAEVVPMAGMEDVVADSRGADVVEIVSTERSKSPPTIQLGKPYQHRQRSLPKVLHAAYEGDMEALQTHLVRMSEQEVLRTRDAEGNTALHLGAESGNISAVEILIRKCPKLVSADNKAKLSPAGLAIKNGQIECLDWMLEHTNLSEELFNTRRRHLLHYAAKFGQDGCLRLLLTKLSSGGNIDDYRDTSGNSPAHLAAKHGHLTCLQTLVEFGVDVCQKNEQGHTPCYYADFSNHRQAAGYLMLVEMSHNLAEENINTKNKLNRLKKEHDELRDHLRDSLGLNAAILKQWQQQQGSGGTFDLLEMCSDLMREMMVQIESTFTENCVLKQRYIGAQDNRHMRAEILDRLNRAKSARRRIDKLEKPAKQTTVRQWWIKVKEMERRLMGFHQTNHTPEPATAFQTHQLIREMFSEAIQQLVVYRTQLGNWSEEPGLVNPSSASSSSECSPEHRQVSDRPPPGGGSKALQEMMRLTSQMVENEDMYGYSPRREAAQQKVKANPVEKHHYENIGAHLPPIDLALLDSASSTSSGGHSHLQAHEETGSATVSASANDVTSSAGSDERLSDDNKHEQPAVSYTIPPLGDDSSIASLNDLSLNIMPKSSDNQTSGNQTTHLHSENSPKTHEDVQYSFTVPDKHSSRTSSSSLSYPKHSTPNHPKHSHSSHSKRSPNYSRSCPNERSHVNEQEEVVATEYCFSDGEEYPVKMPSHGLTKNKSLGRHLQDSEDEIHTDMDMNPDELDLIDSVSQVGEDTSMPTGMWNPSEDNVLSQTNADQGNYHGVDSDTYRRLSDYSSLPQIPVKLDLTYVDFKETYDSRNRVSNGHPGLPYEEQRMRQASRDDWQDPHMRRTSSREELETSDSASDEFLGDYDDEEDDYDEDEEILMDPNLRILPSMQFDMALSTIEEASIVSGSTTRTDDGKPTPTSELGLHLERLSRSASGHNTPVNEDRNRKNARKDDRPWYETSDDEDRSSGAWQHPREGDVGNNEHFTLF